MERLTAAEVIELLGLVPLPGEGGYYLETYRGAKLETLDGRSSSTAIYYFLTPDTYSALHVLASDEVYHFYAGDPVGLTLISPNGAVNSIRLGSDLRNGERCQQVVPAGFWQGSKLLPGGSWALMGTTVAPGFEFSDCRLIEAHELSKLPHPNAELHELLARPFSL